MFGIKMYSTQTHLSIADQSDDWKRTTNKWSCTFKNSEGKTLSTKFYMGWGLGERKPELLEVLGSLVLDAQSVINAGSFGEWMADLGYTRDSRDEAYKVYKLCASVNDRLEAFMTDEQREAVLEAYSEM